jgi:rfaE bifunctional protein nucleotidyltransferase chain/domain
MIAQNETRESGSFMGDQLCSLKAAYLFVEHAPPDVDRVIMSVSPGNEMHFLWEKFIDRFKIELVYDNFNPGDWVARWQQWNQWFTGRKVTMPDGEVVHIDHYRELYLRIHGAQRQNYLCGSERGLNRRNIYQYWWCGQEQCPDELPPEVDWFDDTLAAHPKSEPVRDVYISPHAKTQGNITFTFEFWANVVHKLIDAGVTVTVGYDGHFCENLNSHPLYRKFWGNHKQWMDQVCAHKLVACGNTGTGWLAAACGTPMITMEPPNSQMPDHRYRECGLRNILEVVDTPDASYVARRIIDEIQRVVVMTTGCYDILHAGHVRHLERSKALGTRLVVALNSDTSVKALKGPERPINPEHQRKAVLEALRCVDEVRLFDGPNAIDLIKELKPDVLTAGFGYEIRDIVGRELVESWGGQALVTSVGDARNEPSTTKIVRRMRKADILEVCKAAQPYSVNPLDKLRLLAEELLSVAHLPGDIADLGSCQGGSAMILRRLVPDKHLYLFDTWEGTPYDDELCHHKRGEWKASLVDCQKLVGVNEMTHYYQGVFPDYQLLANDQERKLCFVYVDMDTEQATYDAINIFWPRMVPGGKIVIDDYGWEPCAGVRKAVDKAAIPDYHKRVVQSLFACILEK